MGNDASPNGVVEIPGTMGEVAQAKFRENWGSMHGGPDRKGNIGILSGGARWVQTSFSPEDAQLILSRGFSIAEIARLFNLPQHMLGLLDHATFSNIEDQNIMFYQLSLLPWLSQIEQELSRKLFSLTDRQTFNVRHDPRTLLRGNMQARADYQTKMFQIGGATVNQVLAEDGQQSIGPAGDEHYINANNLVSVEQLYQQQQNAAQARPDRSGPGARPRARPADPAARAGPGDPRRGRAAGRGGRPGATNAGRRVAGAETGGSQARFPGLAAFVLRRPPEAGCRGCDTGPACSGRDNRGGSGPRCLCRDAGY